MYGPMGYGWESGMGLLGFGIHGAGMLLFWGLLIWLTVTLVRRATRPASPVPQEDTALTTLRERFARGELTREQFESMREVLR